MLSLAIRIGKNIIDIIGRLLSTLRIRATYSENLAASRSIISKFTDYNILDKATILLTPTAYSDARVHSVKTYTGDELVTNGDFANWTGDNPDNYFVLNEDANNYVTESNGQLRMVSDNSATIAIRPEPTTMLTAGNTYRVSVDLTFTTGTLNISGVEFNTDGTKVFYLTASTTYLQLAKGSTLDVLIDNLSIVDVSSDFDFDRASSATRINSDGLVQDMQSITDPELVLNGDFEELGDNVLIGNNSTFDSGIGNWVSYGAGTPSHSTDKLEVNVTASEGGASIPTNSLFTGGQSGKLLKVRAKLWLGTMTNTAFKAYIGGVQENVTLSSTPTYYDFYLKPTGTQNLFIYKTSISGSEGTFFIDDVSVQQVDPNDRWSLGTGWSIEDGEAILTNGSGSLSKSDGILEVGKTYLFSIEIISISAGAFSPKTNTGQNIFDSVTLNTVGVHTSTFTVTGGVNLQIRASGTTTGTIDNVSLKDITFSEDVDLARINYDSNGENGHWLLEPTSTNLVGLSEFINPSQTGWAEVATNTYTNNYSTAPDGNQNSTRVQFVNPNSSSQLFYLFNSTSGEYSASIYAKGSGTLKFGFYDNASVLTDTITLTSEWQRFEVTKTLQTTSNARFWIYPEGASAATDIEIWGAQVEALSYATSYIPTLTGSAVTRATETLTGSGNSTLINSTEGVLYAEIAALADDGTNRTIALNKDTNDRIQMYFNTSTNGLSIFYKAQSGATSFIMNETLTDATSFNKIAFKWKANDFALWVNGVETDTVSSGVTPTANTLNALEFEMFNDSSVFYGKVKALAVFDEALSDDELELLTGITNYGSFNELAQANGYTII